MQDRFGVRVASFPTILFVEKKKLKEGEVNFIEPASLYPSQKIARRQRLAHLPPRGTSFSPPRLNITISLLLPIKGDSRFHPRVLWEGPERDLARMSASFSLKSAFAAGLTLSRARVYVYVCFQVCRYLLVMWVHDEAYGCAVAYFLRRYCRGNLVTAGNGVGLARGPAVGFQLGIQRGAYIILIAVSLMFFYSERLNRGQKYLEMIYKQQFR